MKLTDRVAVGRGLTALVERQREPVLLLWRSWKLETGPSWAAIIITPSGLEIQPFAVDCDSPRSSPFELSNLLQMGEMPHSSSPRDIAVLSIAEGFILIPLPTFDSGCCCKREMSSFVQYIFHPPPGFSFFLPSAAVEGRCSLRFPSPSGLKTLALAVSWWR